jgi:hypothetical protein
MVELGYVDDTEVARFPEELKALINAARKLGGENALLESVLRTFEFDRSIDIGMHVSWDSVLRTFGFDKSIDIGVLTDERGADRRRAAHSKSGGANRLSRTNADLRGCGAWIPD